MDRDYIALAAQYQADVLAGIIPACKWVKLAAERNRRDLDRQETEAFPYRFDPDAARRICQMAEMLPHIKGADARVIGHDVLGRPLWNLIVLQPWQIWVFTTLFGWLSVTTGKRRFRVSLILVPRKNGKALALDTPIATIDGWKTMGTVAVGDRVFGSDGEPVEVVGATETMIGRPCQAVTFSDGSTIVADEDHLWRAYDRWREHEVVERTSVMAERVNVGSRTTHHERRYRVPVAAPLKLSEKTFLIDPYVLGAWLGDGHTAADRITTADSEVIDHITASGETAHVLVTYGQGAAKTYGLNNRVGPGRGPRGEFVRRPETLHGRLRTIGVLGHKHIPEQYFQGSERQRWDLLQGLMDTDGTVAFSGPLRVPQCSFTSVKHELAEGVLRLVSTLGLKATLRESRAKLYGRDCGPVFDVTFTAYADSPVFRLQRKSLRLKQRPIKHCRSMARTIVGIERVPSVPVRCIEVARPDGMYLVGNACIPTHNSVLGAIVALYMLTVDGEGGPECYSVAKTRDQAKAVAEAAWHMAKRSPQFCEYFGIRIGSETTMSLAVPARAGKFAPLASDANSLDGLNVHLAVIDELHAHPTGAVWNVMDTGTGAREQSMLFAITTAGVDIGGICHQKLAYLMKILDGAVEDERFFGLNYTIDEHDDIRTEEVQRKANPNYGVSVQEDDLQGKILEAYHSSGSMNTILTKHFDVWIRTESGWMGAAQWQTCAKAEWGALPAAERYATAIQAWKGFPCWIGVDLGEVRDPSAVTLVFKLSAEAYGTITRIYWPEDGIAKAPTAQLAGWARDGFIVVTAGNEADYARIQADLVAFFGSLNVQELDFDRKSARLMMQGIRAELEPKWGRDRVEQMVLDIPQSVETMDPAMKTVEGAVLGKRIEHDGNPAVAWMVSNVVIERNHKGEIYPRKAGGKDSPNKIDGPVSMFTAVSRAMIGAAPKPRFQFFVAGAKK